MPDCPPTLQTCPAPTSTAPRRRLLLIGSAAQCQSCKPAVEAFTVVGNLEPTADPQAWPPQLQQMQPQLVLIVKPATLPSMHIYSLLNVCEEYGLCLYALTGAVPEDIRSFTCCLTPALTVRQLADLRPQPGHALIKRLLDVAIATSVLISGLPLWLLIAMLVKLGDNGPVFYVQWRAGKHGKPFPMLKFRSMVADSDMRLHELVGDVDKLAEPVVTLADDPRVTRLGRILRRTSLDEIPQLLNVILGQMSLVGPRPEWVTLVQRYNPWQRRRLKAKPGITGLQQIECRREPSLATRVRADIRYLQEQSLYLDMKILLRTLPVVIRGHGAR